MLLPQGTRDSHKIQFVAVGDEDDIGYGLLGPEALKAYRSITRYINTEAARGGEGDRLWRIAGCMRKLDAVLLQGKRLREHHDALVSSAASMQTQIPDTAWEAESDGGPLPSFALRGDEACADFESLLLQGRAALDRLTFFVGAEFKQRNLDTWYKLPNVLGNFASKDPRAATIRSLFDGPFWAKGIYRNLENGTTGLRSFVAHRGAIAETITSYFTVLYTRREQALVFDCESRGNAILRTSWETVQHLPHLLLNAIAALIGGAQASAPCDFAPEWNLRSVVISDFEGEGASEKILIASRMASGLVRMTIRGVHPSILDRAIKLPSATRQSTEDQSRHTVSRKERNQRKSARRLRRKKGAY